MIGFETRLGPLDHHAIACFEMLSEPIGVEQRADEPIGLDAPAKVLKLLTVVEEMDGPLDIVVQCRGNQFGSIDGP